MRGAIIPDIPIPTRKATGVKLVVVVVVVAVVVVVVEVVVVLIVVVVVVVVRRRTRRINATAINDYLLLCYCDCERDVP